MAERTLGEVDTDGVLADPFDPHLEVVDVAQNRRRHQAFRWTLVDDADLFHGDDLVGVARGEVDVVKDHHDGLAELVGDAAMIDRDDRLAVVRQCGLRGISRSALYY